MDNLYHVRRMFGGSLPQAWPTAAVALQFADGFLDAYRSAWEQAEILFNCLDAHPDFRIERIPNGTHIVRLHVTGTPLACFRDALRQRQIHLPQTPAGQDYLPLRINPSLNRSSGKDIAQAFIAARG
jgi:threonine aldolase